ncbi:MAG: hypothetical protein KKF44_01625, partial [Nanoarchaeota archaeon]|nr:hypothetical protein [Nanoarchaeota archaeon]
DPINIFDYFFYDYGPKWNKCSAIEYNIEKMPEGIEWLEKTARSMASKSQYFASIADKVRGFIESPAYSEMTELIDLASGRHYGKSSHFVDEMMMHEMMRGHKAFDYSKEASEEIRRLRKKLKTEVDEDERDRIKNEIDLLKNGPKVLPVRNKLRPGREKEYQEWINRKIADGEEVKDPPTFLEAMRKITLKYLNDVNSLRTAMRDFEWALTLARSYETLHVPLTNPRIGLRYDSLKINQGRNLPLVLSKEDPLTVVIPNDVYFSNKQNSIAITGANGGGKTHLLEMIANNAILAHKGMKVFADSMYTTPLYTIEYSVDASVHGESASAFQNEIKRLIDMLNSLEKDLIPGEKALVIFDEPFKGTDTIDGVPLLIGLMKYMESRGIYFAYSTHFNSVGAHQDILNSQGIHAGVYTMDRETHKLIPGIGRSYGITVAEEFSLSPEIIEIAKMVQEQAELESIHANGRPKISNTYNAAFKPLSETDIEELGIIDYKGNLGNATSFLSQYSYLGKSETIAAYLTAELTEEQRANRIRTIDALAKTETENSSKLYSLIGEQLQKLTNFESIFYSNRRRTKGIENMILRVEGKEDRMFKELIHHPGDMQDHKNFVFNVASNPLPSYFATIRDIVQIARTYGLSACEPESQVIDRFFESRAYEELNEFIEDFRLLDEGKIKGMENDDAFTFEDWKDWNNLCFDYQDEITELYRAVLGINFYATIGRTIDEESWTKVIDSSEATSVNVLEARNTRLEREFKDKRPTESETQEESKVTSVDIDLDPTRLINILSGTNGGGKTQFLQAVGSQIYFKEQLGYVPAEYAEMGHFNFMYTMLTTATHSEKLSSFQNEVLRIRQGIEQYIEAGEPTGGVVILDEPFKGTSEEEAIPLLIGLIKYFERRGVQVLYTTHFSGIYDYLEKLDEPSRVGYRPLFVDYFSDKKERYKVKEGIGKSSGIRVAEVMGVPSEIIEVAKDVYNLTNGT